MSNIKPRTSYKQDLYYRICQEFGNAKECWKKYISFSGKTRNEGQYKPFTNNKAENHISM